jgi:hypothetical protein
VAELAARRDGATPAAPAGTRAPGDAPRPPRVELVDPLADSRWGAFVARAPDAGVFHHRAWLDLLRRTYGFPMTACCLVDAAGTIHAGAPLALVGGFARRPRLACVPFAASCPPLPAPEQDPVQARALGLGLDELARAMRMPAEVRGAIAPLAAARVSARWYAHHIPLAPDADRVLERAPDAAEILRGARSLARAGLTVERGTDARALADFYRVHLAARRREGAPSPPRRFVLGLAHLFDRGLGCLLLVRDRGRALAGAVLLCFNGTVLLQYGASGAGAADSLLRLEALRWSCHAGMRTLDLGRTARGDERARELNLSWGAEERGLAYHELGPDAPVRSGAPGAWAAPLIRNSPAIVGRVIGEAVGGAWA